MVIVNLIDKALSLNGVSVIASDGDDRITNLSFAEPGVVSIYIGDDLSGEVEYIKIPGQDNTPNLFKTFDQSELDEATALHQAMVAEGEADKQASIDALVQQLIDNSAEVGEQTDIQKATDRINETKEYLDSIGADYSRLAEILPAETVIANGGSWYDVATQIKGFVGSESEWEDDNHGLVNKFDYYRQALSEMDAALSITDKFITRSKEYEELLPFVASGTGQVNAFVFELSNPYNTVKSWRKSIMLATVERLRAIKAGGDRVEWRAALDAHPLVEEDSVSSFVDSINNQGDFRNTSDTLDINISAIKALHATLLAEEEERQLKAEAEKEE